LAAAPPGRKHDPPSLARRPQSFPFPAIASALLSAAVRASELWRLPLKPRLIHVQNVTVAQDHRSLNPRFVIHERCPANVGLQQFESSIVNRPELLPAFFPKRSMKYSTARECLVRDRANEGIS